MNKSQELKQKYKHLFQPGGLLAVSDGWLPSIELMLQEIDEYLKQQNIQSFEILQIKEKFGQLRVYTSEGDEQLYAIIRKAAKEIDKTCEICGTEGQLQMVEGWLGVRCERHKDSWPS